MCSIISITVQNLNTSVQNFCFFQEPAAYSDSLGQHVHAVCLASRAMAGWQSGVIGQVDFSMVEQHYAGVQTQTSPPTVNGIETSAIAATAVDTTAGKGNEKNQTTMSLTDNIFSLSVATYQSEVPNGAFQIVTPVWDTSRLKFNIGVACLLSSGKAIMSNFIDAPPNKSINVTPQNILYVTTGDYQRGMILELPISDTQTAKCDATSGVTNFMVTYNPEGTWSVVPSLMDRAIMSAPIPPPSRTATLVPDKRSQSGTH